MIGIFVGSLEKNNWISMQSSFVLFVLLRNATWVREDCGEVLYQS